MLTSFLLKCWNSRHGVHFCLIALGVPAASGRLLLSEFWTSMQLSRILVASVLARIKLAYKKRQLYVTVNCSRDTVVLLQFFRCLRTWGLISHFESCGRGFISSRNCGIHLKFKLFLRYCDKKPAVYFWSLSLGHKQSHIIGLEHLHRLAWHQPGVTFVLSTGMGLLSLQQCLLLGCSGRLFLAVRAA